MSWPRVHQVRMCPWPGCSYPASSRTQLNHHFTHRHPDHTLVFTDQGHPIVCEVCGTRVTPCALAHGHINSGWCLNTARRKHQRQLIRACHEAEGQQFSVDGVELERVDVFTYLGRPLSYKDSDWPALRKNLTKARQKWAMLSRILERWGEPSTVREVLQGSGAGCAFVWIRDMGMDRPDGEGTGRIPS